MALMEQEMVSAVELAAEAQRGRGLAQGSITNMQGNLCTLGSLAAGAGVEPSWDLSPGENTLLAALYAGFTRFTGHSVCGWNNEPGRTSEQVVAKLYEFADWLRAGGAEEVLSSSWFRDREYALGSSSRGRCPCPVCRARGERRPYEYVRRAVDRAVTSRRARPLETDPRVVIRPQDVPGSTSTTPKRRSACFVL